MGDPCSDLNETWWKAVQEVFRLQQSSPIPPLVDKEFRSIPADQVRAALKHQANLEKARSKREKAYESSAGEVIFSKLVEKEAR